MNITSRRESLKKFYEPVGELFLKYGFSPNFITLLSLFLGSLSALAFYHHKALTGALLLFLSGLFDLVDGEVARLSLKTTKFGAVFDWISDKWVDGMVLGAIGIAYSSPVVAVLAITLSMLHSFIKPVAYAEIGYSKKVKGKIMDPLENVGFFGRPETHISIIIFSLLERISPVGLSLGIKVVTLLTFLSLCQRIIYLFANYSEEC